MTLDLTRLIADVSAGRLTAQELRALTQAFVQRLETVVGEALSAGLTDEQLAEFEAVIESQGDAQGWLTAHRPDYPVLVTRLALGQLDELDRALRLVDVERAQSQRLSQVN